MTTTVPSGETGIPLRQETTNGPSAQSDGQPGTAGGGIERLNAFDGLFLRSEHLRVMQDYARELAIAVGAAGGPGVVEGYTVTWSDDRHEGLTVGPGLAIDAQGRPLRSNRDLTVSVGDLPTAGDDAFYWVEIRRESWRYEDVPVTGTICDEPCAAGATERLYEVEGVRVLLVPGRVTFPNPQGGNRRPWLASQLFARERTAAQAGPPDISDRDAWAPPEPPGQRPTGVRLAVYLPSNDLNERELDVWAARRDRGAPPPVREWQWRLGLRPWDVFVAQILQFQSTLADYLRRSPAVDTADRLAQLLAGLADVTASASGLPGEQVAARLRELRQLFPDATDLDAAGVEPPTLPGLRFGDLPAAGFLPYTPSPAGYGREALEASLEAVREETERLLGPGVTVTVCTGRPVDVAQLIQEAQHRDRIPLDRTDDHPAVQVLVPVGDGGTPFPEGHTYLAFARQDGRHCPTRVPSVAAEEVDVYIVDDHDNGQSEEDLDTLERGALVAGSHYITRLRYPAGEVEPLDDEQTDALFARVRLILDAYPRQLIVLAANNDPVPEVVQRRRVFAETPLADQVAQVSPRVFQATPALPREAIILVVEPNRGPG